MEPLLHLVADDLHRFQAFGVLFPLEGLRLSGEGGEPPPAAGVLGILLPHVAPGDEIDRFGLLQVLKIHDGAAAQFVDGFPVFRVGAGRTAPESGRSRGGA